MDKKLLYAADNYIIGTKDAILQTLKDNFFDNNEEMRHQDAEVVYFGLNNYYDTKEQLKDMATSNDEDELFMVVFNDMDGSPVVETKEELGSTLISLLENKSIKLTENE